MTPRVRVALLAIAALVLVPCAVVGMVMPNDTAAAATSLVGADEQASAVVAVPAKSSRPALPRGLPQTTIVVTVVTAVRFSLRRRSMRGLPFRLGDVGDRWRALLCGAPPAFL